ncbi:hypothetical protein SC206_18255 [Rouxiella sp. T17]|uniref:hypothetical protein n=1 Tax=Rouxiella sp. T17 TaxID=3085684 RepID=UPI002FC58D5F
MKAFKPIKGVNFALPKNGRVLLIFKNGQIVGGEILRQDEHIASLMSLLELAEQAGYTITASELD